MGFAITLDVYKILFFVILSCTTVIMTHKKDLESQRMCINTPPKNPTSKSAVAAIFGEDDNGYIGTEDYSLAGTKNSDLVIDEVAKIKYNCGDLCDVRPCRKYNNTKFVEALSSKHPSGNLDFHFSKKNISCGALWNPSMVDEVTRFKTPPKEIPKNLKAHFTYNTQIPIESYYFNDDGEGVGDETKTTLGNVNCNT